MKFISFEKGVPLIFVCSVFVFRALKPNLRKMLKHKNIPQMKPRTVLFHTSSDTLHTPTYLEVRADMDCQE